MKIISFIIVSIVLTQFISSSKFEQFGNVRTVGDFSHFAESLFEPSNQKDQYYIENPTSEYDMSMNEASLNGNSIHDIMNLVITPENKEDNLIEMTNHRNSPNLESKPKEAERLINKTNLEIKKNVDHKVLEKVNNPQIIKPKITKPTLAPIQLPSKSATKNLKKSEKPISKESLLSDIFDDLK